MANVGTAILEAANVEALNNIGTANMQEAKIRAANAGELGGSTWRRQQLGGQQVGDQRGST